MSARLSGNGAEDQIDESLLADLPRPDGHESALAALAASSSLATIEVAVPQLVLLAAARPADIGAIAPVLRRLDHNTACLLLVPAVGYALRRHPSAAGWESVAELARQAFPAILGLLRDAAMGSDDPAIRAVGAAIAASYRSAQLVERRAPSPFARWAEVLSYGQQARSREDLVRLLEAMADTRAYLETHPQECPEWRNRDLKSYLTNLKLLDASSRPRITVVPQQLYGAFVDLADWYAAEPCIPDDPALWSRTAAAFCSAATRDSKPDERYLVIPFTVAGTECEFYLGRQRAFLRLGAEERPLQRLRDLSTWLNRGLTRTWEQSFEGHAIKVQVDRERWFPAFKPTDYRVFVDRRLVAYVAFILMSLRRQSGR